ncbi:hypothetical protein [Flavobacterium sp.]
MAEEIHNKLKWYEFPMAVLVIIVSAHIIGKTYKDEKLLPKNGRWRIGK